VHAPTTDSLDPLQRERDHLASSRAALRAMREDVESLDLRDVTGTWVSAAVLQRQISSRIAALADLAHTPLFFGRLDYLHAISEELAEGGTRGTARSASSEGGGGRRTGERFYIGRRHVHDAVGDPMVIDWRAPVSQPFYRASRTEPLDVERRRRFGYTGGELTAYEDENLSDPAETETSSALLAAEIEKPRVGPMRDIVATIQPEQDEIVRADIGGTVCVQGAPGTGKTAVGLHRVAYLLYAHRERLARTGTLVIGPNSSFLNYIEQVLPALGELDVAQATVQELVAHVEVRGTDEAESARLKGDPRMAEVLRRAVRSGIALPTEPCVVVRGSRRWRVPVHELVEIIEELKSRDIRYGAAREALPQRIAHAVLVKMEHGGEAPDDRVQDAVARNPQVKAVVKECWPPVDPAKLVHRLLSDADFLADCATPGSRPPSAGPSPRGRSGRRRGPSRMPYWSTRRPTWCSAPRRSGTWSWTRPRTSPPCSTAPSGGAAPPARRPSSATSPRAPPLGRRRVGRTRCSTSASPPPTSRSSPRASGCPRRSSRTPHGCCPRSPPASPRRRPSASCRGR
jgi:hypothetical protein